MCGLGLNLSSCGTDLLQVCLNTRFFAKFWNTALSFCFIQMSDQETMRRNMAQLMATVEDLRAQSQRHRALLIALMNVCNRDKDRETSEPDITKYVW